MLAIIRCRIFCLPGSYPKNLKIKIYRTIILPVVLYGCETWSLTLREERKLRVHNNHQHIDNMHGEKLKKEAEGV